MTKGPGSLPVFRPQVLFYILSHPINSSSENDIVTDDGGEDQGDWVILITEKISGSNKLIVSS